MMNKPKIIKSKNVNNIGEKLSRKSIGSDNLHVPLTSSVFWKIKPSVSRVISAGRSKSYIKGENYVQKCAEPLRLFRAPPAEVPENVAVHFATFYQDHEAELPHSGDEKLAALEKGSRNSPKMEFTRQMVYRLEHSAGTHDYGKQLNALLDDTVESPNFDLKLPPPDNCAPQSGKRMDYFPLWYKDPSKMPLEPSRNHRRYLPEKSKDECRVMAVGKLRGDDVRTSESSSTGLNPSSDGDTNADTEVELDTETEYEEEVGGSNSRGKYEGIIGRAKSHLSSLSSRSSRSEITWRSSAVAIEPRGKRLRNSRACRVVGTKSPISVSFSRHSCTGSTQNSQERETDEEKEEEEEDASEVESVDWETTEDEDEDVPVGVKVVADLQKIVSTGGRDLPAKL